MINTALYDLEKRISGEGVEKELFLLLPELRHFYDVNATCDGVLSFPKEANAQPISINTE